MGTPATSTKATSTKATSIRGPLLHLIADPFDQPIKSCCRYFPDGLLVVEGGQILAVGHYQALAERYAHLPTTHYPDKLIIPGLIDTHIHFPQTEMIAAYGEQLLTWLDRYTFPTEQKFSNQDYASIVAHHFLNELLSHGTTTALVFTTVYPESTEAFFEAAHSRRLRMIAGKVLMDRHAPEALLDTPESAYAESKRLIEKWHGCDRLLYAVTPRFAITSTPEQLAVARRLLQEFPGVYLHTHLAENPDEIKWTAALFPAAQSYLDVYEQAGLVGSRSVFAHGIHLSETELATLSHHHCSLAHCPTSNLFLGSGLFPLHQAKNANIKVGLGTDIGAGTSFSLLATGGEAYKVAQLLQQTLSPFQALFLATLGGAQALWLDDKLGNFMPGKEADFVVLDPKATTTLAFRNQSILERLQALGNHSQPSNQHSANEHSANEHSANEHSANEHSANEHSANEHSANEHSANEHSANKQSGTEQSDTKQEGTVLEDAVLEDLRSLIFSLLILGDDRSVFATYIAGQLAHKRQGR